MFRCFDGDPASRHADVDEPAIAMPDRVDAGTKRRNGGVWPVSEKVSRAVRKIGNWTALKIVLQLESDDENAMSLWNGCKVTASALARPLWRLRRYQSELSQAIVFLFYRRL